MNQFNDTDKLLDLNCLLPEDAIQIVKTKIFEQALVIYNKFNERKNKKNISRVV